MGSIAADPDRALSLGRPSAGIPRSTIGIDGAQGSVHIEKARPVPFLKRPTASRQASG
jgi:hypothetical protein